MKEQYYIESIKENSEGNSTAIISCRSHIACIEVYGDQKTLTQRVIAIINGLNGEQK